MMAASQPPPSSHLMSPEDDELPPVVRIMVLKEVSKSDRELFAYLMKVERVELDEELRLVDPRAPVIDAWSLAWWEARGVIHTEADPGGRLWISKTRALEELLREPSKKNGRRVR